MAFDWMRLDRDERRRLARLALLLGILFTALGAVGIVVSLAIGRPAAATGNAAWVLAGLVSLVIGLRARRRAVRAPGSGEQDDRGGEGDGRTDGVQPPPA